MKLLRVGEPGSEKPALLNGDQIYDLSPMVPDIDPMTIPHLIRMQFSLDSLNTIEVGRIAPPISKPGKVVCVGGNYAAHINEAGMETSTEPPIFLKAPDAIVGPYDTVLIPPGSSSTDYEVELAIVIGATARYLTPSEDPLEFVAGYAVSNDISERDYQLLRGGQWDQGKSCETFNPLGPWLVTPDEVDLQDLELSCQVNGDIRQRATTRQMLMSVGDLIRYVSQYMVLRPGDIINSGTPAGVAFGYPEPKPYLRSGDLIECSISGLGMQRCVVAQAY